MDMKTGSKQNVLDKDWVPGSSFEFEASDPKPRPSGKRTSIAPKTSKEQKDLKNRRKSILLKRLEIPEYMVASPSLTRKTRQQSMVSLSKSTKIPMARATSQKVVKSRVSKSTLTESKPVSVRKKKNNLPAIKSNTNMSLPPIKKSPKNRRKSMSKLKLQEFSPKLVPTPSKTTAARTKVAGSSEVTAGRAKKKIVEEVLKKKWGKGTINKNVPSTPIKFVQPPSQTSPRTPSPHPLDTKRITRSAMKSSCRITLEQLFITKRTTPNVKQSKQVYPFTPKPDDPSNILKRQLKRKMSMEIRSPQPVSPERIDNSPPSPGVLATTPASNADLPPTPKSAKGSTFMSQRRRVQSHAKRREYLNSMGKPEESSSPVHLLVDRIDGQAEETSSTEAEICDTTTISNVFEDNISMESACEDLSLVKSDEVAKKKFCNMM